MTTSTSARMPSRASSPTTRSCASRRPPAATSCSGLWAAEQLGKSGADADAYAKSVVLADFEEAGDEDVLRKVQADLDRRQRGRARSARSPTCGPGWTRSRRALSARRRPRRDRAHRAFHAASRPSSTLTGGRRAGRSSAWCGLPESARSPALLAREDFDAVALDMQHGPIDLAAVLRAIPLITAAGKPAMVRIPVGEFATVSRLLDAGASAVIAPMINTPRGRAPFASFLKYPPIGRAQLGHLWRARASRVSSPPRISRRPTGLPLSFAMIETREALAILDDILADPGSTASSSGPSDLSIALSGGERLDAHEPGGRRGDRPYSRAGAVGREDGGHLRDDRGAGRRVRPDGFRPRDGGERRGHAAARRTGVPAGGPRVMARAVPPGAARRRAFRAVTPVSRRGIAPPGRPSRAPLRRRRARAASARRGPSGPGVGAGREAEGDPRRLLDGEVARRKGVADGRGRTADRRRRSRGRCP